MSNVLFDDEFDGRHLKITWCPNIVQESEKIAPIQTSDLCSATPILQSEEVWELVKEWYKAKKTMIPIAEVKACKEAIEKEKEDKLKPIELVASVPMKPEYGTPSFWADYWAKKKAGGYVSKADEKKKKQEEKETKAKETKEAKEAKEAAKAEAKAEAKAAKAKEKEKKIKK